MDEPVSAPIEFMRKVHRNDNGMIPCVAIPVNLVATAVSQAPSDSPLPRCRICFPDDVVAVEVAEEPPVEEPIQSPIAMVTCPVCNMQTSALERFCSHCRQPTAQTPD